MKKRNKRFALWGGLFAVMILVIIVMVRFAGEDPEVTIGNNSQEVTAEDAELLQVRENDWTKGNPDADVVIVKYSDFQCPACRFYASIHDQLSRDDHMGDEVLFVYRYYPLRGFQHSRMAARYAEAAGRQDQFWRMHDLHYINQHQWVREDPEDVEQMFRQFADSMNLDMDQLEEDLQDPELVERIESDYEDGSRLGVRGVPTIFIQGERIQPPGSIEEYTDLIESYF